MWLVRPDIAARIEQAYKNGTAPTAAQQEAYAAEVESQIKAAGPRNLRIADGVAEIRVEGVLTPRPDLMARWFGDGNTTYSEIIAALAQADADHNVKRISLFVDSPGGRVKGMFDAMEALRQTRTQVAVRTACACSAAYGLAATAGPIVAVNEATEIGSIGVAVSLASFSGVEVIDITSTNAPNKRPDPKTEEGRAVIRKNLDDIHDLFVKSIAEGRGVKPADVNANYGRGAVLLAAEAKKLGMIDGYVRPSKARAESQTEPDGSGSGNPAPTAAAVAAQETPKAKTARKTKTMDKATLKAEHPDTYASIFEDGKEAGIKEGEKLGESKERDRVTAHLTYGKECGAMDIAQKAIEEGASANSQALVAKYMTANRNNAALGARAQDDQVVGDAVDGRAGGGGEAPTKDVGDVLADRLEARRGKGEETAA
jgi:capsid assembly protease